MPREKDIIGDGVRFKADPDNDHKVVVHRKIHENALCGSDSRELTSQNFHVNCPECIQILGISKAQLKKTKRIKEELVVQKVVEVFEPFKDYLKLDNWKPKFVFEYVSKDHMIYMYTLKRGLSELFSTVEFTDMEISKRRSLKEYYTEVCQWIKLNDNVTPEIK